MNNKVNFSPIQNTYKEIKGIFKNWCLTNFPFIAEDFDALTYYEMLCKLVGYLNDVISNQNLVEEDMGKIYTAYDELQDYVNNYFTNLDVQEEINNKLDSMVESGELSQLLQNLINQNYSRNNRSVHLSLDDCSSCFNHLVTQSYTSLFDEPLFNYLKNLHEKYNICVSLYVFTDNFNVVSNIYATEFKANSNWLKIGYHALNNTDNLNSVSYTEAQERYNNFINNAIRICGTNDIIDRFPRLANYVAPSYCINGLIKANNGIIGLLSADDDRLSYDLETDENNYLNNNNEFYSQYSHLFYIKSNLRLENTDNVTQSLNNLYTTTNASPHNLEVFTHEYLLYANGEIIEEMSQKITEVCEFIKTSNIPYDFVQNKYNNMTGALLQNHYGISNYSLMNNNIGLYHVPIVDITNGHMFLGMSPDTQYGYIRLNDGANYIGLNGMLRIKDNLLHYYTTQNNLKFSLMELVDSNNRVIDRTPNGQAFNKWTTVTPNILGKYEITPGTKFVLISVSSINNDQVFTADDLMNNIITFW